MILSSPGRNKKILEVSFLVVLFSLSFYYFLSGSEYFDLRTYHYDEGIVAYGATSILEGDMPYRDFWTLYSPGVFYALAGVFKLFGISLNIARMFTVVILSITVCCIYWLIKKMCSRVFGIFAFLLAVFWLKSYMVYNRPGQLAILSYVLCSVSLFNFFDSNRMRWLVISGILSGGVCLFRQDFGIYTFGSIFLVILLESLMDKKTEKSKKQQQMLKRGSYLIFGFLSVILPVAVFFLFNMPAREIIYDTLVFPLLVYPKVRDLPLPKISIESIIFYVPMIVFLLSGIKVLFFSRKTTFRGNNFWLILFFLVSGAAFMFYASIRSCFSHLLPAMIPVIILFVLFLRNISKSKLRGYRSVIFESFLCIVVGLAVFYLLKPSFLAYAKTPGFLFFQKHPEIGGKIDIARASGFYDDSEFAKSMVLAVKYIQDNTGKNEKIFVGNSRHDRLVNSDVLFYFLSQRDSATKYYELHPGLTDTPPIQDAIISDLIKQNVRYIVLWSGSENVNEPNKSSRSSGITALDDFIRNNYKIEMNAGSYAILKKRYGQ